jgi:hypothetical protein
MDLITDEKAASSDLLADAALGRVYRNISNLRR